MSDLIERQAAIDVIDYLLRHNDDAKRKGHSQVFINGMEDGYFRVRSDILSLPSVQPRNICEGCKYLPRFCNEEPCVSCSNNYENKWKGETDGAE